ncbi:HAD-IA family hydrolase [Prauserella cavernicola]|uniref:HAD-IA family hydrolase n=1 Tax=Prauserella cavernicola TaxID=2800127 RepID=A0A934QTH1_9PSEU|nr:HAD-IA family hydrolase [Prauserella cavernicola]MBK1786032.1 HAD-IA family hydrolase [Prauserella cavernicola]
MIVTFDLFSALTDSRRGGAAAFAGIAGERGWPCGGEQLYDEWDRRNKRAQQRVDTSAGWVSFRDISRDALAATYTALDLDADADTDIDRVQASVGDWPLWPDVAEGLPAVAAHVRIGILSNVDDELAVTTRAHSLVDAGLVLSSQRLGAYKPDPDIYLRARDFAGDDLVHVATSARDVRGALEAGIHTVRLVRPGHRLDPAGPVPAVSIDAVPELLEHVVRDGTG